MNKIAIIGASGHGKVLAEIAEACGWKEISFFDDSWPSKNQNGDWKVIGNSEMLVERLNEFDGMIIAIGNNKIRFEKQIFFEDKGAKFVNLIHPFTYVSQRAKIGNGTVIMPGAVVNVDSVIGKCCIVNTGATIDHDCVLKDAVHISPGANLAGGVSVDSCTWIGVGSSVKELIKIGSNSITGAGSVVIKNVGDNCVVAGSPAKAIK